MPDTQITVKVKYFAELRDITKKREEVFQMKKGSTVFDVFTKLSEVYGETLSSQVFTPDKQLSKDYMLLLNGRNFETPHREAILQDGDEVVILPPVAGGFS